MAEYEIAAQSFPAWKAILWCFYPVGALVAIEYFLRSVNDDDDDDGGGGTLVPAYNPI
jgi:hypothetical protein